MGVDLFIYARVFRILLLLPWPSTDDLDIRAWPRYSEEVPICQI